MAKKTQLSLTATPGKRYSFIAKTAMEVIATLKRLISVLAENRIITVEPENRIITVPEEDRIKMI